MGKFRKGDVVTIEGTIDSGFEHEGKIKVRIGSFSDAFASVSDIKMVRPIIEVGDRVAYPADGYNAGEVGEVLAIIDGYCWVKLATEYGSGRVSWPVACVNRVDPPDPASVEPPAPAVADEMEIPAAPEPVTVDDTDPLPF
ncbi:hypothetical protein C8D77_101268 [Mesorhizobium loti]|uniref:Uncharacterized protein n=1 Tax=Rhizobium loti TaxID=381 RepID=A0A8E3B6Q4_RHILI|nr:hypothetical protein [Mesorhizobium loti]PWJ93589.1 hypothetical protein C8D77_101268 [Mesorhizobium loti]